MLFNSFNFLLFFPAVLIVYFAVPDRVKHIWLLISSYYFYMCWNVKYSLLILTSTVITYLSGVIIEKIKWANIDNIKKTFFKKMVVICSVSSNLMILFWFKYINFVIELCSEALSIINIETNVSQFDIILPIGISFYTFQALSYTIDVYKDDIYAEKNFFRYALFVSFFPQLVAGPIERSKNLLKQLVIPKRFEFEKAREGFLLMLWGYFLKIVIADRIAIFVDCVFGDYYTFGGWYIIVAMLLFAVQIYCDFAGYSVIAMGSAKILGISLMDNFDAPYLSISVDEFWRRWHISLTSWFKDYLYIPLGGSRKGKIRKYLNKMVVFLTSGLWHGADLSFVIWGGLNGIYQIIGEILMPIRNNILGKLHINKKSKILLLIKCINTFILIDFSWIFFRANNINTAIEMIKSIVSVDNFDIFISGDIFNLGMDKCNFVLMFFSVMVLLIADIAKRRKIEVRNVIVRQNYFIRCVVISFFIVFILIFGIYGSVYDASGFIYFQF